MRFCMLDAEAPPWIFADRDGLAPILIYEVMRRLGVAVRIDRLPRRRSFLETQRGDVDGTVGSYVAERGAYPMVGDKPDTKRRLTHLSYSLFKPKGSSVAFDGKTISGLSMPIGIRPETQVIDLLKSMNVPFDDGTRVDQIIMQKMVMGRVSAAVMLTETGDKLMAQPEFAGKFERVEPVIVSRPYFVFLSKKFAETYPAFAEQIWDTVALVRESAAFRKQAEALH